MKKALPTIVLICVILFVIFLFQSKNNEQKREDAGEKSSIQFDNFFEIQNGQISFEGETLDGADPETFQKYEKISGQEPGGYYRDTDQVWYLHIESFEGSSYLLELDGVNPDELERSNIGSIVNTQNQAYLSGYLLEGLNPKSMNFILDVNGSRSYLTDGNTIFFNTLKLESVDVDNFTIIDSRFSTDGINVYERGKLLSLDGKTFKKLSNYYVKDSETVLFRTAQCHFSPMKKLVGADAPSFEVLVENEWSYIAKDRNNVYVWGEVQNNGNPKNIEITEDGVVKDENNVYSEDGAVAPEC